MAMDQYLLIPFLGEWTSIYQLFWCSPGVQGFDTLPNEYPWVPSSSIQFHCFPGTSWRIAWWKWPWRCSASPGRWFRRLVAWACAMCLSIPGSREHLGMNQKMKPPWEPEILGFMFSMNHLIMGVPVFDHRNVKAMFVCSPSTAKIDTDPENKIK